MNNIRAFVPLPSKAPAFRFETDPQTIFLVTSDKRGETINKSEKKSLKITRYLLAFLL
jgi:hypothetical protein